MCFMALFTRENKKKVTVLFISPYQETILTFYFICSRSIDIIWIWWASVLGHWLLKNLYQESMRRASAPRVASWTSTTKSSPLVLAKSQTTPNYTNIGTKLVLDKDSSKVANRQICTLHVEFSCLCMFCHMNCTHKDTHSSHRRRRQGCHWRLRC